MHSLITCTMARCVWALDDPELVEHIIATAEPNAKAWIFSMQESMPHSEFTKLAVTLWAIWTSRRKAIHEAIFQTPHAISAFITRYIKELDVLRKPKKQGRLTTGNRRSVRPRAPPANHAKIHVDAGV